MILTIQSTKFWKTLTEAQKQFWLQRKCLTCFYLRMRFKNGETHCNNIARRKELGREYSYTYINRNDEACKRYRNEIVERERRNRRKK